MKLASGLDIVSLEKKRARVRLMAPCAEAQISASAEVAEKILGKGGRQLWGSENTNSNDNFNFETVADVMPRDEDYIFVRFRAISKRLVQGHWLDFTRDGVLEEGVAMLRGTTVYPNHEFWRIEKWLGSVSQAAWDAGGAGFGGVPGINAEYKIDALMNPRIARGLLMRPPAIHSTSLTVLFEFEYSHPDLAAEYKFWSLLGEEVGGEIVRLIVTKIHEIWEASLVYQGADRLAKQATETEGDEEDFESMSAAARERSANSETPANQKDEEKKMKLTEELKKKLGIEVDGDDVPEGEILKAAESLAERVVPAGVDLVELQKQAAAGAKHTEALRKDVTRLAKLSELGADEGDLDAVIADDIKNASFDRLTALKGYYEKKAADRFPTGRKSLEDKDEIEGAGGVKTSKALPSAGVL